MKYKVGDRVIVRDDLCVGEIYKMEDGYTYDSFEDAMRCVCGHIVTIKNINGQKYGIVECGYNWVDGMFVGLADEVMQATPSVDDLI